MPRPPKNRRVNEPPLFTEFKPMGVAPGMLDTVVMTIDEYEALRLADYEGMSHEQAAEQMEISRPTFTRLLDSAHKKLAQMLVQGKRLIIEGGNVSFRYELVKCYDCGHMFRIMPGQILDACPVCGSKQLIHLSMPPGRGFGRGRGKGRGFGHGYGRRGR